jgi:hypothetical protein
MRCGGSGMARRRIIELAPGAELFNRTARQWHDLGAPVWVVAADAATERYVEWARFGFGRGSDPADEVIRKYFVEMQWLPWCVRPQFLAYAGALTAAETQLMTAGRSVPWGRPAQCRSRMLDSEANVPGWLSCCRQPARPVHAADIGASSGGRSTPYDILVQARPCLNQYVI